MSSSMQELTARECEQVSGGLFGLGALTFKGIYWAGAAATGANGALAFHELMGMTGGGSSGPGPHSDGGPGGTRGTQYRDDGGSDSYGGRGSEYL